MDSGFDRLHGRQRPLRHLAVALMAAFVFAHGFSPLLCADTILDHSAVDPNGASGTFAGGNWVGFLFTAPSGSDFDLYEISASFGRDATYTGDTDFQIFTLSGVDLIPFSTRVAIADSALYTGSILSFDFASDAVTVDLTSQGLTMIAGTEYYLLTEHNGITSNTLSILRDDTGPVGGVAKVSVDATLMNPTLDPVRDPAFLVTGVNVPEPGSLFLVAAAGFIFSCRRSRRLATASPVLALFGLFLFSGTARASLIMDESSHTLTGSVGSVTGGRLTGFEFTTPTGPSFTVGEIKGSWYSSGYSGATDFRIYSRLGADLTPISTAVSIASIPNTSTATFDFATHATTIDFSSQSILLDPNMAYTLLAEHNGGGGTLGIHFSFSAGTGPIVGAGRISGSNSLDDASFEDHNDMTFQVFDAAPVPEPGTLLFLGSAAILLLTRRSRLS